MENKIEEIIGLQEKIKDCWKWYTNMVIGNKFRDFLLKIFKKKFEQSIGSDGLYTMSLDLYCLHRIIVKYQTPYHFHLRSIFMKNMTLRKVVKAINYYLFVTSNLTLTTSLMVK